MVCRHSLFLQTFLPRDSKTVVMRLSIKPLKHSRRSLIRTRILHRLGCTRPESEIYDGNLPYIGFYEISDISSTKNGKIRF